MPEVANTQSSTEPIGEPIPEKATVMGRNKIIGLSLAAVAVLAFVLMASVPRPMPTYGADGTTTVTTPTVSWPEVFSAVGGGTMIASVLTFLKSNPELQKLAAGAVHSVLPGVPVVTPGLAVKDAEDCLEILKACQAYAAKRDDVNNQRRLATAFLSLASDMGEMESDEIAIAVNQLGTALISKWFPAKLNPTPVVSKGS